MKLGTIIGLFVLGAGLFLIPGQDAHARPGTKKAVKKVTNAQLISALRNNNVILAKANGNYQGHRAAAFKKIQSAMKILAKEARVSVTPVKIATGDEVQKLSDTQLKKVIADLGNILNTINNLRSTKARQAAAEHITQAIAELETALTVA